MPTDGFQLPTFDRRQKLYFPVCVGRENFVKLLELLVCVVRLEESQRFVSRHPCKSQILVGESISREDINIPTLPNSTCVNLLSAAVLTGLL